MTLSNSNVKPLKKMKKMKKFILSLGLIAVAFSLTNCSQNDDFTTTEPTPSVPFELFAPITKTINNGVNTLWEEEDKLNVFHAITESSEFVKDNEFTLVDVATGRFQGGLAEALAEEQSYDWYVSYPYSSAAAYTKPGVGRSFVIGNTNTVGQQTQNGNGNMSHLAGNNFPVVGVATNVAASEVPTLTLKNVASCAKFIVKNALSEPITIKSIKFEAPGQHLTGYFFIDFTDMENILYTPDSGSGKGTSDTATLAVSNGSAIAANGQAEFYLAIAPFAKAAGEEVTFTITATNGDSVEGEWVKSTTAALTFVAGWYKDITLNYNTPFESVTLPSVSTESEPYIVGFEDAEGFKASSSYKEANIRYTGAENKQWGTVYGTPSTTSKISGEQSMHIKTYPIDGAWSESYTFTNFTLTTVKQLQFVASTENANNLKVSYKVAGSNWVDLETFTLSGVGSSYNYTFDTAVENAQFKFTIVPTKDVSGTGGKYVIIDDVTFTASTITATIAATTAEATNTETTEGTKATLNGSYAITNASGEESVTCGFEYKLSSASDYTTVTATAAPSFSYELTTLTTGSEYTYRAWASLDGGTTKAYGEEKVFTPTALAASVKSYELTSEDMGNIGVKWTYTDEDIKTVSAADGSTWTAYQATRSASSTTIGVKKDCPDGYLATPVVNGNITKIIINATSTGASTKFALASDATSAAFYTSDALGKTTQDWSVDITNNCKQIFIHSAYGTVTINAVTVYYTEE